MSLWDKMLLDDMYCVQYSTEKILMMTYLKLFGKSTKNDGKNFILAIFFYMLNDFFWHRVSRFVSSSLVKGDSLAFFNSPSLAGAALQPPLSSGKYSFIK